MTITGKTSSNLPPGFRFHPTDEELIMCYLRNQATSRPCPVSLIPEVDIYKFDPWDLPDKAEFGENEWYFFSPRDRKYPNGARPNRAAVSGYWKATGTDKAIHSGSKYVGIKKALVFYKGKPPKGSKTDWIMHEYRLSESISPPNKHHASTTMRLDDWVLCRIYKKKNSSGKILEPKIEDDVQIIKTSDEDIDAINNTKFPRPSSISHLWELEYIGSISQILNENTGYSSYENSHNAMSNTGMAATRGIQFGEMMHPFTDSMKFQVNQSNILNQQPLFVNQIFEFQ